MLAKMIVTDNCLARSSLIFVLRRTSLAWVHSDEIDEHLTCIPEVRNADFYFCKPKSKEITWGTNTENGVTKVRRGNTD